MIWTNEIPDGDDIIVGCAPGSYYRDLGQGLRVPDTYLANAGMVKPVTRREAQTYIDLRASTSTPYVFADRQKWWDAGGSLPGQERRPVVNEPTPTPQPTPAESMYLDEAHNSLLEAQTQVSDALSFLGKARGL